MKKNVYLAVDLGASSGRVMAATFADEKLALEEVHRFGNGPESVDGTLRWKIDELRKEIQAGVAKAAERFGQSIRSIGVDTWGVDYGLVDAQGNLTDQPFCYRDERNGPMMDAAFARMPREKMYDITGIQFMSFNTVFQMLADTTQQRAGLADAKRLLFMPDLINFWLSGVQANERTIASTGQLLDARTGQWSQEIIDTLGIRGDLLGDLVPPGTVLGSALPEWGITDCDVVATASHDTASAVASVPFDPADGAYLSSGTWSLLGIESQTPIINQTTSTCQFTNEGGVEGTIRLLKNIGGLWLVQECRRQWAEEGEEHSFAELAELAAGATPFQAVIDPDAEVFATPGDMPARIREYCRASGQSVPESKGAVIRTALESLAHRYRQVLDQLEEVKGESIGTLHIVGGGIQNRLLNAFAAGATGRQVITGPIEATSIGNVITQMIAHGELAGLKEGRALVKQSFPAEVFEPKSQDAWEAHHQQFLKIT